MTEPVYDVNGHLQVEMTEQRKSSLIESVAQELASSGKEQYNFAREGFPGVNNMTQLEFNYYWAIYGID